MQMEEKGAGGRRAGASTMHDGSTNARDARRNCEHLACKRGPAAAAAGPPLEGLKPLFSRFEW